MRQELFPLYAIAAVVLVGGLVFAGVSPIFLLILACPLMMVFMMRGMDRGGEHHDHEHHDTSGR
jgi:hypothetical protein